MFAHSVIIVRILLRHWVKGKQRVRIEKPGTATVWKHAARRGRRDQIIPGGSKGWEGIGLDDRKREETAACYSV